MSDNAGPRADLTSLQIPVAARYAGAWAEINSRLLTRNALNVAHVAAIIALTAAHFSIDPRAGTDLQMRTLVATLPILASTLFVMWYWHNDLIIGALTGFCATLEAMDHAAPEVPGWFHAPGGRSLLSYVQVQRKLSDLATMLLCCASPILLAVDLLQFWGQPGPDRTLIMLITVMGIAALLVTIVLVAFLAQIPARRDQYRRAEYRTLSKGWTLP